MSTIMSFSPIPRVVITHGQMQSELRIISGLSLCDERNVDMGSLSSMFQKNSRFSKVEYTSR